MTHKKHFSMSVRIYGIQAIKEEERGCAMQRSYQPSIPLISYIQKIVLILLNAISLICIDHRKKLIGLPN